MERTRIEKFFSDLFGDYLSVEDYCYNGLQVEGKEKIKKVLFSVNVTEDVVKKALSAGCDALVVHHGLFWKPGALRISGGVKRVLELLLRGGLNLFAFHLPLDLHPEVGTCAALFEAAGLLDGVPFTKFRSFPLGFKTRKEYHIGELLERFPGARVLRRRERGKVVVVAGSGNDFLPMLEDDVGIFLTGEISLAGYLSAPGHVSLVEVGHSRSEEFGVKSLMNAFSETLNLEVSFYESEWYK